MRKCNYNSLKNQLCRHIDFQINEEMLKINARILKQPQIHTGLSSKSKVQIGRIPLDGHLFTPKPITALAITYFGTNVEQDANLLNDFSNNLLFVSFYLLNKI